MFYLCFCYNAHVHVAENVQQRPLVYTFRWVAEFGVTTAPPHRAKAPDVFNC